jgi:hypothetical protein
MLSWCRKMGLAGLPLLAVLLLAVSPSLGGVITENFNNNQYDQKFWWVNAFGQAPTANVTNNSLVIDIPANSTGYFMGMINSNFVLAGDFDVQCNYSLPIWPSGNGLRAGICLSDGSGQVFRASFGISEGVQREVYYIYFGGYYHEIPTIHTGGLVRLKRTGNKMEGFCWQNSAWQLIGSYTDASLGKPVGLNINTNAGQPGFFSGQAARVIFDNIQVTYNRLVWGNPVAAILGLLLE